MRQCARATLASGTRRFPALRSTAFVLWVAALLFLFPSSSRAQISPGPLSRAHSPLSGTTQCSSCHVFGANTPIFKCLDCHREVSEALANKHGYHFRLQIQNPNGKDCVRCHLEHNGKNFNLIHWEPSEKTFNHKLTGYPLEGKHTTVPCEQCHTPATMLPSLKALIKYEDPEKSFFAQSPNCTPCHADPHKAKLGNDCAKCHNAKSWQSAKEFDHSKTKYPLTGLHTKVACDSCHKPDKPGGPARYQNLKFDACASCHSDPHRGEFKKPCEFCHTTTGWKNLQSFDFDHSKTKYPLLGKHAHLGCTTCHVQDDFKKEIAFAACKDCHTLDPHKGQFADRPQKGECAECHTVEGWKPSLFTVKQHDTTDYPLKGKHAQVDCSLCHILEDKDAVYKLKFAACADCHKDAHDNQFAAAPFNHRCESCHSVADWHRTSYSIAKHASSRFSLLGAHAAVPCSECHKIGSGGRSDNVLPFHFADRTCTACHTDPHKGQFNNQMARTHLDGTALGCEACHNLKSWGEISGFDHSKTMYPLLGAHRTVACNDCHKPTANSQSRFSGTPTQCEACHQDVHDGQFRAQDNQTHCADCHIPQRWSPSTFDHETKTHFSLAGGHVNVLCAKCHTQTRTSGSKEIVIYKNAPGKCADCHGNRLDQQKS